MTEEKATFQTKLRHVDMHNHWLRQAVKQKEINVTYPPSSELMADGLTKALQGPVFTNFTRQLGLTNITDRLQQDD
jgi:hypothetical protein